MMVERNMEQDLKRALSEIVGLRCAQAQNPFGSTLVLGVTGPEYLEALSNIRIEPATPFSRPLKRGLFRTLR